MDKALLCSIHNLGLCLIKDDLADSVAVPEILTTLWPWFDASNGSLDFQVDRARSEAIKHKQKFAVGMSADILCKRIADICQVRIQSFRSSTANTFDTSLIHKMRNSDGNRWPLEG